LYDKAQNREGILDMRNPGNWEKVIKVFKTDVEQSPTNSRAFFDFGVAYECAGSYEEARTAVGKACQLEHKSTYLKEIARCERLHRQSLRLHKVNINR
jgi:Flp pilus assembly protein TadD